MTAVRPPSASINAPLASLGLALLVSILTGCYYDPYAFQARSGGYTTYGRQLPNTAYRAPTAPNAPQMSYAPTPGQAQIRQPAPAGSRQGVYGTPQAPTATTYQTTPQVYPYSSQVAHNHQEVDNRWYSGNTWETRQQGAKVNARGSGDAWRNRGLGQRRTPLPDASATWQTAPTYPTAGTTYPTAGTTYPTAGTTYPTAGTTYPTAGTTYPTAGTTYPSYGVGVGTPGYGVGAGVGVGSYTVQRGDNLSTIARNLGCSVGALMQVNGLTSTVIQPGQVLNIPR